MWALYQVLLAFSDTSSEPPASRAEHREHGEEDARDVGTAEVKVAPSPRPARPEPTGLPSRTWTEAGKRKQVGY